MLTYDPYRKPAIAYRTAGAAFKDAEYAEYMQYGERKTLSVTPLFVAALTVLGFAATIVAAMIYS